MDRLKQRDWIAQEQASEQEGKDQKPPLLDPALMRRLERLHLVNRRMIRGTQAGKRRSRHGGSSLDFNDYRLYTPGDDLRQLDWPAYARTGKLFLKTFLDEREWHLSLYLDLSKSMAFGSPSKFHLQQQVAAALGFLTLHHVDRLSVYAFRDQLEAKLTNLWGKGKLREFLYFLDGLKPGKTGSLNKALTQHQALPKRPGLAIILSDFFFEDGYQEALRLVQAARQEVLLVHILAEEELDPHLEGDIRLVDSETKAGRDVSLSPSLLANYRKALRDYQGELSSFARKRGMGYLQVATSQSLEQIIYGIFQPAGWLR